MILMLALLAMAAASCTATRYSDARRYLHDDQYMLAQETLLKDTLLDGQAWTMLAECRFHLQDYVGLIEASRKSLALSRTNDDRIAYYLHEAYVLQLRKALPILETGGNHEVVKALNEVVAFGQAIPPDLDPRVFKMNQKVAGIAMVTALQLRDDPNAQDFLEELRHEWYGNPELMERLAFLYHQIGDDSSCADLCTQILMVRPDHATVLRLRAQTLSASRQDEAALTAFRSMLDTSDDRPEWHRDLGILMFELGDWQQALLHLEQAYRSDDTDSLALLIIMGECAFQDGRFQRAMDYYQRALQAQPYHSDLHRAIGACHWSLGHRLEAQAAFARAARPKSDGGDQK